MKDEQGEADKVKIMMRETVTPSTSNFGSRLCDGMATSGFKSVSTVVSAVHFSCSSLPPPQANIFSAFVEDYYSKSTR